MRIYLAAPFNQRGEAMFYKGYLEENGYEITSRWLTEHNKQYDELSEEELETEARVDLTDIETADAVVLLNFYPASPGRFFEFGYAYAFDKPIVVLGDTTKTIFTHLPGVTHLPAVGSAKELLEVLDELWS